MSENANPGNAAPSQAAESQPVENQEVETSAEETQESSGQEAAPASEAEIDADPSLSKAEKKEAKRNLKKLKLKVDGKEIEEEIDLDNEEYLTKQIQLAKAAQKRMSEYAQLEKEVKTFVEELRKNPKKILADPNIGIDIKQLAAQIIEEEIENSKKSPEQIEKEALQRELEEMKSAREREKEELRQRELERLQEQEFQRYDMLMTQALEKHSDLPKSPYVVKKMADYMLLALEKGMDVSPEDVIPLVRDEIREDLKQMFAVLPEDVVEQIVGKEKINGIRKKNLAKAKAAALPKQPVDTGASSEKSEAKPGEKKSFKDFFGI